MIHATVVVYAVDHPGERCPTVEDLHAKGEIGNTLDPWAMPYAIVCKGDEVIVLSFGPDGKGNTDDDIRTPHRR